MFTQRNPHAPSPASTLDLNCPITVPHVHRPESFRGQESRESQPQHGSPILLIPERRLSLRVTSPVDLELFSFEPSGYT